MGLGQPTKQDCTTGHAHPGKRATTECVCLYLTSSINIDSFVVAAVEVIRNNMAVRQQNDLRLYLDVVPDSSHVSALRYRIYLFHAHRVLA